MSTKRKGAPAPTDVEFPRSKALAIALHRLLTDPRGWPLLELQERVGLKDRAFRNFRHALKTLPEELGGHLEIVEETVGEQVFVRLRSPQDDLWHRLTPAIGALQVSRLLMGFLGRTPLGEEFERLAAAEKQQLRERGAPDNVLDDLDRKIRYLPYAPKNYANFGPVLHDVLHAVFYRHRLKIKYRKPGEAEPREHEIEPYTILVYQGGLYVVARPAGQKGPRTFAIERIESLVDLEKRFDVPSDYSPEAYVDGCFGIFRSPDARSREVELVFAAVPALKAFVRDRTWHRTQRFTDLPDGRLRMTFRVDSLEEVARWVRSFGDEVEVVKPAGGWEKIGFGGRGGASAPPPGSA